MVDLHAGLDPDCAAALQRLYHESNHRGSDGAVHVIDSSTRISPNQGARMVDAIFEHKCKHSLEIGLAYGFSTLHILGALAKIPDASHTSIDPFEEILWHGVGLEKVKEAKKESRFSWRREDSLSALAALSAVNERFDFIYIDADHRFDGVMVDFYGSDRVLSEGGILAFDDLWMPAVRALLSFVDTNMVHLKRLPSTHKNLALYKKVGADSRPWWHFMSFDVPSENGSQTG